MKRAVIEAGKLQLVGGILFLSLAAGLGAAETGPQINAPPATSDITVESLVADVLQKNPELGFYRAEITAAKAGRKTAGEWANPELTGSLGNKRVWERHGPSLGDGPAWAVSLAQPFEFPGRIQLRKAIADRQIDLAQLGLEQFQATLASRTRQLASAVLVAQDKAEATREVAGRLNQLLEVVVQREPAGVAPQLDTRILEANALVMNRRASQASQELQAAFLELNLLRGESPSSPLKLTGTIPWSTNLPPLATLLDWARTNNFDLRMRQSELAQQGFKVQLSKNERWPTVTLAPYYTSEKAADSERMAGVALTVPLPVWNQHQGNVQAQQARLQQAEALLQNAYRQVEKRVAEEALALQSKEAEMARWRPDSIKQLRQAADLADRHYRLGAVAVTSYVEMQLRYLEALEALLATSAEALGHRQQLELLVGRSLDGTAPK